MIETSIDILAEVDENILTADGFDDAIIGYIERSGLPIMACYDKDKCIEILAKDMSMQDAEEYFYFNTLGSYVGDYTPCFFTAVPNSTESTEISV